MIDQTQSSLTVLLNRWQLGDDVALQRVLREVMLDLEKMAEARMRGEDRATIAPNDLLHEALLRVIESQHANQGATENGGGWRNRAHFFANMSLHMRSVLVDRARARQADKRGGGALHVTLSHADFEGHGEEEMVADLLALDEILNTLAKEDARGAEILHLTYFAGMSRQEIADAMSISIPTVDRELRFARAWLAEQLGNDIPY